MKMIELKDLKINKKFFGILIKIINNLRYKQLYPKHGGFEIGEKYLDKPRNEIGLMEIIYESYEFDLNKKDRKELFDWCDTEMKSGEDYIKL